MATSRFFDWFQFGILVCWGMLGVTRAVLFRRRGVRVLVADRRRSFGELMADGLASACLLIWAYEVVAHAWSFSFHPVLTGFDRIVVDNVCSKVVGAILGVMAVLLYAVALRHLGVSWRFGIDRATPGPLVTGGVYRWTRHPIYVAFDLIFVGTFLMSGRLIFLVLALVWIPLLHGFMRREERFLAQHYGAAYAEYCGRVGRYFSWPKYDRQPNAVGIVPKGGSAAPVDHSMEIRRYQRGEESAVWGVFFAATHESNARDYHPDLIERWAPHDQDMGVWSERLARKNPFIAVVDAQIVGMAEIEPDGFIDFFYVHPRWQGRGVGKALLATLESEAAKLGVKVIRADVSITAKEFFLSKGFRITETRSNVILGHPAPNFRMQKVLHSEL